MKIVLVTGMQGAGKSELALAFNKVGIPVIVMGDVIREEVRQRGLEPNPTNTKKVMLDLREKDGMGAVAIRCLSELKEVKSELVVIEGCRSIAELEVFDDYAEDVKIICVHTSPYVRYKRLKERGREDAPPDWASFRERDLREISVGLGGVIALSDIMLVNEDSLEDFRRLITNTVAEFI
ncbi:MAG: AAA family ATPase [Candidatus Thorarchaeota archaeon]